MAFSILSYTGNGVQTDYAVSFPYLAKSHVQVFVNSVLQVLTTNYTWLNDSTVRFNVAPANGAPIQLRRDSSQATALVDFQDASILTEADLDTATRQGLYVAQEAIDGATTAIRLDTDNKYNSTSKVIKNLANGVASQDAVTVAQLEAAAIAPVTPQATSISFAPTGGVSAVNVQTAIAELDTEKAPKASPVFTGNADFTGATIAVPTAPAADNDTSAASTAFVQGELASGRNPNVPVRQTVLSGALSSGVPAALTAGSGLLPGLNASPTPIVIAFANGFGAVGSVDTVSVISAGASTIGSALPANNTSFIYADRSSDTAVTWGQTLLEPQYGEAYDRTRAVLCHFNGTNGATATTDDYGNSVTLAGGCAISTGQSKFGGSSLLLDGIDDYADTPISGVGGESWTVSLWVYINSLPASGASQTLVSMQNVSGLGSVLQLNNTAGTTRLQWFNSSNGSTNDITNPAAGAKTTWSAGTWYHIACGYDAVAGAYYTYVDGVVDSATAASLRLCAVNTLRLGANATPANFFPGYVEEVSFVRHARHPGGVTFTPPVAQYTVEGHFFSVPEMKMYEVTGASAAAGTDPTMTRRDRVFVGECVTGGASVTSAITYAYRGRYVALGGPVGLGTALTLTHNMGVQPHTARWQLRCIQHDAGYVPGDTLVYAAASSNAAGSYGSSTSSTRNGASIIYGSTGAYAIHKTNGTTTTLSVAAAWRSQVVFERGW